MRFGGYPEEVGCSTVVGRVGYAATDGMARLLWHLRLFKRADHFLRVVLFLIQPTRKVKALQQSQDRSHGRL